MNFYRFFLLIVILGFPLCAEAAPPAPQPSSTPAAKSSSPEDDTWFNKQAQIFYGNHIEYIKRIQNERKEARQKIILLQAQRSLPQASKEKIDAEIKETQARLRQLNEDSAKHDVDTAEFGVIAAQRRLEVAKRNLEKIQSQKKSPST